VESLRAIVQRSGPAHVEVDGKIVGSINSGLVLLVGVHKNDTVHEAQRLAEKIVHLRVFNDADGRINLGLLDMPDTYGILAISNFTVYGDASKSRRPSFVESASFDHGNELFNLFLEQLVRSGRIVATGEFGGDMRVSLVNDGPVTVVVDVEPRPTS
jgi:D-tyrosyl-tRNA(Tyr) deacylase